MIFNIQGHEFAASRSICHEEKDYLETVIIYDHSELYPTRITEVPYDRDWFEVAEIAIRAHLRNQRIAA